jgi:hypothetical protein
VTLQPGVNVKSVRCVTLQPGGGRVHRSLQRPRRSRRRRRRLDCRAAPDVNVKSHGRPPGVNVKSHGRPRTQGRLLAAPE